MNRKTSEGSRGLRESIKNPNSQHQRPSILATHWNSLERHKNILMAGPYPKRW